MSSRPLFRWDGENLGFADEVKVLSVPKKIDTSKSIKKAESKTEEALDHVLSVIGESKTVKEEESPSTDSSDELWEKNPRSLLIDSSPIYPNGRMIENINHLMMFVRNGAYIQRKYTSNGWLSSLVRIDGKENPVSDEMVSTLIESGVLRESGSNKYKGAYDA